MTLENQEKMIDEIIREKAIDEIKKLNKLRYSDCFVLSKTFNYNEYEINSDNGLLKCSKYIDNKILGRGSFSLPLYEKVEIFKMVFKIGEKIFKEIKSINEFDSSILEFFHDKMLNNNDIKEIMIPFFKEYGIAFAPIYAINNQDIISMNKINFKPVYTDEEKFIEFSIEPYINLSLVLYIVYQIKRTISNASRPKAKKLIDKIPYLYEKVKEKNLIYNKKNNPMPEYKNGDYIYNFELITILNDYLRSIVVNFNHYTNNFFPIKNYMIMEYNNNISVPESEDKIVSTNINFITKVNIMREPFLTAYEYLLQILPSRENIKLVHFCHNCDSIVEEKSLLCYSCKIKIGKELINKYSTKNVELKEKIEKEINQLENAEPIYEESKIEVIYRDRLNHKKYDRTNKAKKNKQEYYKNKKKKKMSNL